MPKVTKAVIPAAGFGTRFLPQTKAMPKEMLPLVDKPIIQYVVEDMVAAGITDIIIVGSSNKRAIEDHFDVPSQDLLTNLLAGGEKKKHYIDEINAIANMANFAYVRQKGPYGTATPLMSAAHLLDGEPFLYWYADDIIVSQPNVYQQLITAYEENQGSVMACLKVTTDDGYSKYGILGGQEIRDDLMKADSVIEKPGKDKAPSDFASVGGFLFTADILGYLDQGLQNLPEGEEFWLTNSVIQPMLQDGKPFFGLQITNSKRYDTGDKLDYVKTVVDFALQREDMRDEVLAHLRSKF